MISSHGYYGLREMPFRLTPDSRYFFESAGHARAIAHLAFGLDQAEGFIVVTGDVGAGKTTLLEQLCASLDQRAFQIAQVVTSQLSGDDLLRVAGRAFGIEPSGDKAALLAQMEARLRENRANGRRTLLAVDEVQSLSMAALEELRMLSNVTAAGEPLMQTILMGQPQFRRMLASPDLEQLRQRVLASYHLGPLSAEETHPYIEHRLRAAGWTGRPAWPQLTSARVHAHSGGIPRRVNRLCARLLLYGSLEEADTISPQMADMTAAELESDLASGPAASSSSTIPSDVSGRIGALEETVFRRERVFRRLMELLGG